MSRRRSFTHKEARDRLQTWLNRKRLTQAEFIVWLGKRDVLISQAYLSQMLTGKRPPGDNFCKVFKEATGIDLVAGLIER